MEWNGCEGQSRPEDHALLQVGQEDVKYVFGIGVPADRLEQSADKKSFGCEASTF